MHELAAEVDDRRVEGIDVEGRVPVEPQRHPVGMDRANVLALPGRFVEPTEESPLGHAVPVTGIAEIGEGGESVPAAHAGPVIIANATRVPQGAGAKPRAIILQAAVHVERRVHVDVDVIELRQRQVLDEAPRGAPVVGDPDTAIVAHNQKAAVVRVYPQFVHVAMDLRAGHHGAERAALILTDRNTAVQTVETVLVGRIEPNVGVVERPRGHARFVADGVPCSSAIVGAKQRTLGRFHERIDDVRVVGCDGESHATELALGHPVVVGKSSPVLAAVIGHVEAAPFATRLEEPRPAPVFPHGGKQFARIRRIHDEVGGPGARVHEQHSLPVSAAVGRLEHAPLLPIAPGGAQGGDVCHVRIGRVEYDAMDALRFLQAEVHPRVTAVHGLVDAPPHAGAVARIPLARAHPHQIGVGLIDGDGPDRRRCLVVEDRAPGEPPVDGFPHPAGCRSHVDGVGIGDHRVDGGDPSTHAGRANVTRLHGGQL